jgi:DNA-binding MarR family transcriptional regulator
LSELAKEELSQNDLVQCLNLAKSSVSRMVDKLVERGWIQRERSPLDGRVWLLSLTDAGKQTAVTLSESRQTKFSQLLNHIPAQEQETVFHSMDILIKAMRESSEST